MDKNYIPKHLDEPAKFLFFTIDELIALVVPLLIGLFSDQLIIGMIMGIGMMYALKKLKGEEGHYYLFHLLYWYMPQFMQLKATPNSYIRDIVG